MKILPTLKISLKSRTIEARLTPMTRPAKAIFRAIKGHGAKFRFPQLSLSEILRNSFPLTYSVVDEFEQSLLGGNSFQPRYMMNQAKLYHIVHQHQVFFKQKTSLFETGAAEFQNITSTTETTVSQQHSQLRRWQKTRCKDRFRIFIGLAGRNFSTSHLSCASR